MEKKPEVVELAAEELRRFRPRFRLGLDEGDESFQSRPISGPAVTGRRCFVGKQCRPSEERESRTGHEISSGEKEFDGKGRREKAAQILIGPQLLL